MRKIIVLLVALLPLTVMSQRWHITGFGGISNYQGDFQEKRLTTNQSHGAFGLGVQYDVNGHVSIRSGLVYGRISGDDKLNKQEDLRLRNLSFNSRLLEGNLMAEFRLFDLDEKDSLHLYLQVLAFLDLIPIHMTRLDKSIISSP